MSNRKMRVWCLYIVWWRIVASIATKAVAASKDDLNIPAVYQLASRWIPGHLVGQISFEELMLLDENEQEPKDIFEYEAVGGNINIIKANSSLVVVRGTTTSALTAGLGWYLKYECHVHLSWTGNQWNETFHDSMVYLPLPETKVRRKRQGKYSYNQNVCSTSYSMVWWDIQRWYRELDWMALSGINMPLAFQGQEIVWLKTFSHLGLSDRQIQTWLGGPAFMAWQRMGNIQAWGGPMPQAWIQGQYLLKRKLLERMHALGMKPVLPAFTGFVPSGIVQLYPEANITLSKYPWQNFNATYSPVHLVELSDPLFHTIGTLFQRMQRTTYQGYFESSQGQVHYYNADLFNEMPPSSTDLTYLRSSAKALFASIRSADSTGVWVMQGWLFLESYWTYPRMKAYLSGVDDDEEDSDSDTAEEDEKLIVLDLMSEAYPQYQRSDFYFGKTFLFNMLHNFGGNHGMYGRMHVISMAPVELFRNQTNIKGVGLTMEGINQNFIVYDLMTEMSWRDGWKQPNRPKTHTGTTTPARAGDWSPTDSSNFLTNWVQSYIIRRYGLHRKHVSSQTTDAAVQAWQILLDTVYSCNTIQRGATKCIATFRPEMDSMDRGGVHPTRTFYNPNDLHVSWKLLLDAASNDDSFAVGGLETYRYDLVDVTRQVLSDALLPFHTRMVAAFHNRSKKEFDSAAQRFLDIMDDMELILGTHELFLLEVQWLAPSRKLARTHQRQQQNSVLVSEESDDLSALYEFNARNQITLWGPKGEIMDYANKQYAGLMSSYYRPRWVLFVKFAADALRRDDDFDLVKFRRECLALEQKWQQLRDRYPALPKGDTIQVSASLYQKYVEQGDKTWQHDHTHVLSS